MRGHQPLIERRLSGWRPSSVFVADVGMDGLGCWRDWPEWSPVAHIELQPADNIRRLDLRCCWGLTVHLDAQDEARMQALADALIAAGAERVIGSTYREQGEELRCDVLRVFEPAMAQQEAA